MLVRVRVRVRVRARGRVRVRVHLRVRLPGPVGNVYDVLRGLRDCCLDQAGHNAQAARCNRLTNTPFAHSRDNLSPSFELCSKLW